MIGLQSFNNRKGNYFFIVGVLWLVYTLLMLFTWITDGFSIEKHWYQVLISLLIFWTIWDRHKTNYIIEGNFLKSKNATDDQSINIYDIFQIRKTTAYLKPGIFTSKRGFANKVQ